jgi:hypothetical protein
MDGWMDGVILMKVRLRCWATRKVRGAECTTLIFYQPEIHMAGPGLIIPLNFVTIFNYFPGILTGNESVFQVDITLR